MLTFKSFMAQYRDEVAFELVDGELEEYALISIPEYWIVDFH
jgi:hypothetical protein